ncbi:hypothetical protein TRFO_02161 [Tritrichomonas foetus]|uniref:Protein kinase domain-containing protein n=1 Tax=Tritrichomonas foetus TaxID=1144522 RepID=A0A1J4JCS9_9EUKA|nr:hypothetical protein TRFO_02161 [Tritrichomonas foetus]|eukprot:OHS95213.1 hypothetical protein TRFO_02161 [Tritrichomonas foetus]
MEEAYADLYSFLEANDQVSVPVALKLIIDALSALEYLHDNNILHGDIKLENFLLYPIQNDEFYGQKESDMTNGFDLLLSDFETARVIKPNHICKCKRGTAGYISPEFMEGHSLPSDIYAMGVTLRYIWSRTNGQNHRIPIVEDVITSMLAEDPLARPTAKQCRVCIEYLAKRAMGTKMQSYGSSF